MEFRVNNCGLSCVWFFVLVMFREMAALVFVKLTFEVWGAHPFWIK